MGQDARPLRAVPDPAAATPTLTIGELADRTGVSAATLRVWEVRHGFPEPRRQQGGHRRYPPGDVDDVREVVRLRSEGLRLDAAIAQVQARADAARRVDAESSAHRSGPGARAQAPARRHATTGAPAPSVFATLRRLHPEVAPQRLGKRTLTHLSWAIEDEFCARALPGEVFGFFQRAEHLRASRDRWSQVGALAHRAYAFAPLGPGDGGAGAPGTAVVVDLPRTHVMTREWVLVCDAPGSPAVLVAWELPGQTGAYDGRRRFEALWSLDAPVVRRAARACAAVAVELGAPGADEVVEHLERAPLPAAHPTAAESVFARVLAHGEGGR